LGEDISVFRNGGDKNNQSLIAMGIASASAVSDEDGGDKVGDEVGDRGPGRSLLLADAAGFA
jgi:hypothetical protein